MTSILTPPEALALVADGLDDGAVGALAGPAARGRRRRR